MARKRKQSGIDVLIQSPWWVSVVIGVVGYIVLRWLIPSAFSSNPYLISLAAMSRSFAWLPPCGFGIVALISFFANRRDGNKPFTATEKKPTKIRKAQLFTKFNQQDKLAEAWGTLLSSVPDEINAVAIPPWNIESLRSLEWKRFEILCAKYYEATGFKAVTIASGADGGIDVKLFKTDPKLPIAIIQCKAWSKAVGVKEIRELLGVMAHEKVMRGIFITNGAYTPDALAFGASNPIQLLDGNAFLQKIQALDSSAQERLKTFAFDGDYKTPTCASCGIKFLKKEGKRGSFWGCPNYPRCHTTMPLKT